jgi:hypothetical protein
MHRVGPPEDYTFRLRCTHAGSLPFSRFRFFRPPRVHGPRQAKQRSTIYNDDSPTSPTGHPKPKATTESVIDQWSSGEVRRGGSRHQDDPGSSVVAAGEAKFTTRHSWPKLK